MHVRSGVGIHLAPARPLSPAAHVLARWEAAAFEPRACRAGLEAFIAEHAVPAEWFAPAEIERGGMPATDALLFGAWEAPSPEWTWDVVAGERVLETSLGAEDAGAVAEAIASLSAVRSVEELRARCGALFDDDVLELLGEALGEDAPFGAWPRLDAPGVYRREHASVVIRSATTSLVGDPPGLAAAWTTAHGRGPVELDACAVDGVLLTHTHGDHWHLPSVLRYPRARMVVPRVPRRNLLAQQDPVAELRAVGRRAEAPAWDELVRLGDFTIEVLPFYGEQPTRFAPGAAAGLRNWGNCYRVECPLFSVMLLADSGVDPQGNVVEAIARSAGARGPVDAVLSCCFRFPEAIHPGLPDYVLALPFDRLRAIHADRLRGHTASITAGPTGVAAACAAAGARWMLPYAHGYAGLGRPAGGEESAGHEAEATASVRAALGALGASTTVVDWNPGDRVAFDGGTLAVRAAAAT